MVLVTPNFIVAVSKRFWLLLTLLLLFRRGFWLLLILLLLFLGGYWLRVLLLLFEQVISYSLFPRIV